MNAAVERGYFLLADLSGFTAFLAESELDHAQGILEQILGTIVSQLTPTLTLGEVEGDAVFVYESASRISRGELVAELVEATYAAFRDQRRTMLRNATCPCRACGSIGELDLKFVTHFGEFALQEVAGKSKPMGSSINVAHRLLKNGIEEEKGWRGYALYSETALDQMQLSPEGLHESEEEYEHLGRIRTFCTDLDHRYEEMLEQRRVALAPEDVHAEVVYDFDMPPPVVWDWLNDTAKRTSWMQRANWIPEVRHLGRTGQQSKNHCTSFDVIEEILDWRPFDYYTVRLTGGPVRFLVTASLEPLLPGTRVHWKVRIDHRLPGWVGRVIARAMLTRRMRLRQGFDRMSQLMADAQSGAARAAPSGQQVLGTAPRSQSISSSGKSTSRAQ